MRKRLFSEMVEPTVTDYEDSPNHHFLKKNLCFVIKYMFSTLFPLFFYLRVFYRHCMIISPIVRSCGVFTACC